MNKKTVWEAVRYIFFGVLTTVINLIVYFLLCNAIGGEYAYNIATPIAWIVAVAFAFVTNKLWVFDSKKWEKRDIMRELIPFVAARLFSLFVEWAGLWLFISVLKVGRFQFNLLVLTLGGEQAAKYAMQAVVIIMNYVFSKLFIFRKTGGDQAN